jgi:hypothetical protein
MRDLGAKKAAEGERAAKDPKKRYRGEKDVYQNLGVILAHQYAERMMPKTNIGGSMQRNPNFDTVKGDAIDAEYKVLLGEFHERFGTKYPMVGVHPLVKSRDKVKGDQLTLMDATIAAGMLATGILARSGRGLSPVVQGGALSLHPTDPGVDRSCRQVGPNAGVGDSEDIEEEYGLWP